MCEVSDLLVSGWIFLVDVLVGYFVEHGGEEHAEACVVLDGVAEFLQRGNERLLLFGSFVNLIAEPGLVDAMVGREPCS